ncbi:MAG TPA: RyR domain-containing protein [Symbiobacteriaceae bacterium]|nr:RyR domain-containing protein [Symbiobacteriaceae bacterium]
MYDPKPVDTTGVKLSSELLELTELLARNAHDVWARQRMSEGWRYGLQRNDQVRENPCLVPYEDLPESEKEYDRKAAMETIKTLVALGYRLERG